MYSLITDDEKRILKWDGTVEDKKEIIAGGVHMDRTYRDKASVQNSTSFKICLLQSAFSAKCIGYKMCWYKN